MRREYEQLAAQKRAGGGLSPQQAKRFSELEAQMRRDKPRASAPKNRASRPAVSLQSSEGDHSTLDLPELGSAKSLAWIQFRDALRWPEDPAKQKRVAMVGVAITALLAFAVSTSFGASFVRLLPGITLSGGLGWFLLYPATLGWFEFRARRSSAHIREPDFQVRVPKPEIALSVVTLLMAVIWLMANKLSGEGLGPTVGYLLGIAFGLVSMGLLAAMLLRPQAWRIAKARAYGQYMEGGNHHLERNPKRARRLFERACEVASDPESHKESQSKLQKATRKEADKLSERGFKGKADELLKSQASKVPTPRKAPRKEAPVRPKSPVSAAPAQVLRFGQVKIAPAGQAAQTFEGHEEAARLQGRSRFREALELRLKAGTIVSSALANSAAEEYIGQGILRSSFVLREALGQRQIPEFYKAVAVEVSRAGPKNTDLNLVLRLVQVLTELGETDPAARLAVQVVLADPTESEARQTLASMAVEACGQAKREVPGEIWLVLGNLGAAATAFEAGSNPEAALGAYKMIADELLATQAPPKHTLPILSKIFLLDPALDDRYLTPLADHVIETRATGPRALKVLTLMRRRHPDDVRVVGRRFELFVEDARSHDALRELEHLAGLAGSTPDLILRDFRKLCSTFADDTNIRAGLCRALIRVRQVPEAAEEVGRLAQGELTNDAPEILIELIESLYQWGHVDPELRLALAQLEAARSGRPAALKAIIKYFEDGGQQPSGITLAESLFADDLVMASGSPNHRAHLQLGTLHLHASNGPEAIKYLEIARGGPKQRTQAEALMARAELMGSHPERAVQTLMDAIDGRHLTKAPELHFELARAYEALNHPAKAKKIDGALESQLPGFAREYRDKRPHFASGDTQWLPQDDTDVNSQDDLHSLTVQSTRAEGAAMGGLDAATHWDTSMQLESLAQVLAPRYHLIKRIGSGGMGDVHLAKDSALDREVAIKVLRRTLATDLFIAKFREEARTVARLTHPGIVGIYDIGQDAGWSYIVMEYVRGPNLMTLLKASQPPGASELIGYIAQVAEAMQYAHAQSVIHRDLKPANLLVTMDGNVKVTDFGIARILQGEGDQKTAFSAAGLQVGTVDYMAPEQIAGGAIGAATDIYLLGTTLYYCLCRRFPFRGESPLARKLRQEAPLLSTLLPSASPKLDAALACSLAREPTKRYVSMNAFAEDLKSLPEAHGGQPQ